MKLYQFEACHECALVRRVLRGNDIPFEAVTLPLGDKSVVRAQFKSESVPVLVDGTWSSNNLQQIVKHIEAKAAKQ